jgi:hypothetical protein
MSPSCVSSTTYPNTLKHPISQLALFVAEFIQGIGHAMDLKWAVEGKAETGTVCTVQGWLQTYTLRRWLAQNYNLISISGLTRQLGGTYAALATMVSSEFVVIWLSLLGLMLVDHCGADLSDTMAAQAPEEDHLCDYHGH